MLRLIKRTSQKSDLPPGTLVYIGEQKDAEVKISVIYYNEKQFEERRLNHVEECLQYRDKPGITWIDIDGIHLVNIIKSLGEIFGVHSLVLEDIVDTNQRPKIDELEDHLFMVLKMIDYDDDKNEIKTEQVSLLVGQKFVISFQEKKGDIFNPIRDRIRSGQGRIRKAGADYLAYSIMDTIIDHYYFVLEKVDEKLETLEEEVLMNPTPATLQKINNLKKELKYLRKSVWPLKEVFSSLEKGESKLVQESTRLYFKDVYDHTYQVVDTIEISREMLSGFLDIYFSSVSNRMNEVMKVLTIISTIFIPLTFISGIYGMNFRFMPELGWHWGYFAVLLVMAVISIVMLLYFKRKKWL